MPKPATTTPALDQSIDIDAPPDRILRAFFEPDALGAWWQVAHAVVIPRVMGPYAVQWRTTEFRDDLLGRLGGVFRGIVMQYQAGHGFFVADAYWLPPDGDPIGPMAFEVTVTLPKASGGVTPSATAAHLRVVQTGFEESARWRRYYEVIDHGWQRALTSLKNLLER